MSGMPSSDLGLRRGLRGVRVRLADVQAAVEHVRSIAGDDESAHGYEDSLHFDVLDAIANDTNLTLPEARLMAAAALETTAIEFSRWCA